MTAEPKRCEVCGDRPARATLELPDGRAVEVCVSCGFAAARITVQ